jgi:hypothetical protein
MTRDEGLAPFLHLIPIETPVGSVLWWRLRPRPLLAVRVARSGPLFWASGAAVAALVQNRPRTFHEMLQKLPSSCGPIEWPLELPSGGDFTGPGRVSSP